ncbi:MAG: YCF48-related protein, partial [Alphaproteobacteria bacterium]
RLIAVGNWGHVVLSDDAGVTWRQAAKVPTRTTLTSVFFTDDKNGWAVGHDTVVIHTTDGGENWEIQYSDPPAETPLLTVWFENNEHGIAAGSFSFMMETFDGGKTWDPRPVLAVQSEDSDQPHLNSIFWGPDRKTQVMIASEAGNFYRSSDAGKTWEGIKMPYIGSFWGGLVTKTGRVLALGMRGHIFRSDDFGATWAESATGADQSFSGGAQLADGTIIAVGLAGTVSYSSDNGETFTTSIRPSRTGLSAVMSSTNGEVVLFGDIGIERQPDKLPAPAAPAGS